MLINYFLSSMSMSDFCFASQNSPWPHNLKLAGELDPIGLPFQESLA